MPHLLALWDRLQRVGYAKDLEYLTHNIGLLLDAGVDVVTALKSIQSGIRNPNLNRIIDQMRDELAAGDSLSNVFQKSNLFSERVVLLLRIGEESGQLASQFAIIGVQEEKQRSLRSKLRSALMYPGFVFSVTLIVGIAVSWFILPRLARVFFQLKIDLPLITKVILGFGQFLGEYGYIAVPLFFLGLALGGYVVFVHPRTRYLGESILHAIPGVGAFLQEIELARLGSIWGGLLQSGVPILDSIQSLRSATQSRRYQRFYSHLYNRVEAGDSLQQIFSSYHSINALIPEPVQQIIIVGSQSGTLATVLLKVGSVYEEKSDTSTRNLTVILEPLLLIIVWLAVVLVALGVILPIYSLIGGIHR